MSPKENGLPNRGLHRAAHRGAHRRVRTIALPWRKAYVALPAIALIGVGIALVAPAGDVKGVTLSKDSPAVVVPGAEVTLTRVPPDRFTAGTQEAPGLVPWTARAPSPRPKTAKTASQPAPHPTTPTGQGPRFTSDAPATTTPSSPPPSPAPSLPALPIPFYRPTPSRFT